jgi:hypothetical protein
MKVYQKLLFVLLILSFNWAEAQKDSLKNRRFEVSAGLSMFPIFFYDMAGYENTYSGPKLKISIKDKHDSFHEIPFNLRFKYLIAEKYKFRAELMYSLKKSEIISVIDRVVLFNAGIGSRVSSDKRKMKVFMNMDFTIGQIYNNYYMRGGVTTYPKEFKNATVSVIGVSEGITLHYDFSNRLFIECETSSLVYLTKGYAEIDTYFNWPNRLFQSTTGFSIIKLLGLNIGYKF